MPFVRAVIRWLRGVGAGWRGESGRREERKREKEARNAGGKRREEEEEEREKGVGERESVSRGNQITRRGAQAGSLSFTVIN